MAVQLEETDEDGRQQPDRSRHRLAAHWVGVCGLDQNGLQMIRFDKSGNLAEKADRGRGFDPTGTLVGAGNYAGDAELFQKCISLRHRGEFSYLSVMPMMRLAIAQKDKR